MATKICPLCGGVVGRKPYQEGLYQTLGSVLTVVWCLPLGDSSGKLISLGKVVLASCVGRYLGSLLARKIEDESGLMSYVCQECGHELVLLNETKELS